MKWDEAQIPHPQSPSWSEPAARRRVNRQRLWRRPQASLKSGQPERGRSPRNQSEAACSPAAFPNPCSKGNERGGCRISIVP